MGNKALSNMLTNNQQTEKVLRKILEKDKFQINPERRHGENGVDILAEKDNIVFHIEVIGFKISPPARSRDFYEVFFRAVSRIKDGAKKCVIALPSQWENGLPRRAEQYGEAWLRIGKAFPELSIWLIDVKNEEYKELRWNKWLK